MALSAQDYRDRVVREVYDNLVGAVCDYRRPLPGIQLYNGPLRPKKFFFYNKESNTIYVEPQAYEVCATFGRDSLSALAFFIAHEITHYYQAHSWNEGFLQSHLLFNKHRKEEREADVYGAFTTYLSGYRIQQLVSPLFDKMYTSYQITSSSRKYPPLFVRKRTARDALKITSEKTTLFESANIFMAIGEYQRAAAIYKHLLTYFRSRDLYNNLGLAYLLYGLEFFAAGSQTYAYPVEIDSESRLAKGKERSDNDWRLIHFYFSKADEYLGKALEFDPSYFSAHLNFACLHLLRDNPERCLKYLDSNFESKLNASEEAKINILKGIAWAKLDQPKRAYYFWNPLLSHPNTHIRDLAIKNKKASLGKTQVLKKTTELTNNNDPVNPDILTILDGLEESDFHNALPIGNNEILQFDFISTVKKIRAYNEYGATRPMLLIWSNSPDYDIMKKIRVGTPVSKTTKLLAPFSYHTLGSRKGYYKVYKTLGLVLHIDEQETIKQWSLCSIP